MVFFCDLVYKYFIGVFVIFWSYILVWYLCKRFFSVFGVQGDSEKDRNYFVFLEVILYFRQYRFEYNVLIEVF